MAKLISKTYGEALFELATEENSIDSMMEEIKVVLQIMEENPDFDKMMKHPAIPKQEKLQIVENVFKGRLCDELTGFIHIVINKERYGELKEIFAYFIEKVKEFRKIGVAYVTTATALSEKQQQAVRDKLLETTGYQTMEMNFDVDAALIGGMVIRVNDRVVDSSIRTKLNDMTKQLLSIQLG